MKSLMNSMALLLGTAGLASGQARDMGTYRMVDQTKAYKSAPI